MIHLPQDEVANGTLNNHGSLFIVFISKSQSQNPSRVPLFSGL
jgi:hypothetical protein